jgi:hypothetical protein
MLDCRSLRTRLQDKVTLLSRQRNLKAIIIQVDLDTNLWQSIIILTRILVVQEFFKSSHNLSLCFYHSFSGKTIFVDTIRARQNQAPDRTDALHSHNQILNSLHSHMESDNISSAILFTASSSVQRESFPLQSIM